MAESDKRTQGEPFRPPPAPMWNAMVAAGERVLSSQFDSGAPSPSRQRKTDIIKCKNGSGADRAKGEVLGAFTKSLTNLEAGNLRLTGNAPASGKAFGVLLKATSDGDVADELQLSGVCLATVTISDTDHEFADIDPPNFKLVSAESGPCRIIWSPASTGDQECVVRLGDCGAGELIHGVSPSTGVPAIASGTMGSAVCDVYESTTAGALSDSGRNLTMWNAASAAVGNSVRIIAQRNKVGLPVVIWEDCG